MDFIHYLINNWLITLLKEGIVINYLIILSFQLLCIAIHKYFPTEYNLLVSRRYYYINTR